MGFSASGLQQLDLCSALKEPLSVFCVSANWPAGRAAGLQQPAAAAVNIKYSQSASITGSRSVWYSADIYEAAVQEENSDHHETL